MPGRLRSLQLSGRRRALGRLALVVCTLAVSLAVAEGAYRIYVASSAKSDGDDDGWRQRYRHMNETLYRRSADAELVYEPVASSAVQMEYGTAAFDAARIRDDREHAVVHGPLLRVAMVGDSLVWSELVAVGDSLPRRTEEALGGRAEVLNFGVTGYDTAQEARWYETAVRAFHSDVVVVVWCMNDSMIMSGPFERFANARDRARKDAQDALFARVAPVRRETLGDVLSERERRAPSRLLGHALGLVERSRFEARYVDEYLVIHRQAARRAATRAALARLGAAVRADGAEPVLVISPVLEAWDHYHWSSIHAFARRTGEAAGFTVVDPLDAWRGHDDPHDLRVPGDNLHYGEHGNRVFGRTIAAAAREALARHAAR